MMPNRLAGLLQEPEIEGNRLAGLIPEQERIDPLEQEERIKEIASISEELALPVGDVNNNYKQLTAKPIHIAPTMQFVPAHTPSRWERFKKFWYGDRPPLPSDADRIEKLSRAFDVGATAPLRMFFKLGKGMTLNAPDLMWAAIKRITPEDMWNDEVKNMTLEEAMDWSGGYNPSGFQKTMGEMAEFVGRLRSVAPIAQKLGIIGKTPKDIGVLGKAAEMAKLFGTAAVGEQVAKLAATKIDPTEAEYGFEGPKAVLRDMAIGAIFSIAHSGVKAIWTKLTPTEQIRAFKLLGLKKGATPEEITRAANNLARQYHPDKVKGFEEEFKKVIKARDLLRKGEAQDIVFRGQKITLRPKVLPGEVAKAKEGEVVEAYGQIRKRVPSKPLKPKEAPVTLEAPIVAPEPTEAPSEALQRVGEAQAEVLDAIKKYGYGGITEAEQHPNLVAAVHKREAAENDLFNFLSEKLKIGDEIDGYKLRQAKFDLARTADTQLKTGMPVTFDFTGVEGVNKEGDVRIFREDQIGQIESRKAFQEFVKPTEAAPEVEIRRIKSQPDLERYGVDYKGAAAVFTYNTETDKVILDAVDVPEAQQGMGLGRELTQKVLSEIESRYPGKEIVAEVISPAEAQILKDAGFTEVEAGTFVKPPTEAAPAVVAEVAEKQPWEMTREEFIASREAIQGKPKPSIRGMQYEQWDFEREQNIKKAVERGETIPAHILREYKSEEWAQEALKEIKPPAPEILVKPKPKKNIYMTMSMERVIEDAQKGVSLAREAIAEREPERAQKMGIGFTREQQVKHFKTHIQNPRTRPGFVTVPQPPEAVKQIAKRAEKFGQDIKENVIDELKFYPKVPAEFRNDVRKDFIGAAQKARENVFENATSAIWGGVSKIDSQKSIEIIFAKDQLSRVKLGKGNPNISIEEAQQILNGLTEGASDEAKAAAERWKTIHDAYTDKLIERGVLEEGQAIEDHVRHYVKDYTPEWAPAFGIPVRLRRPFRGYIKKAVGTTKEYRQDQDALLSSLMEMEYHNLVEDFVEQQAAKYDIKPSLSREQRMKLFGMNAAGHALPGKPGRIYDIEGKRYRGYSPDTPFSRTVFATEDGLMALGGYKNVSIIPEEIYNVFKDFSARGNYGTYLMNRATSYWKTMAILSHYPSFNVNNMVGDTWMAMVQHPDPMALLREYDTAIRYLIGKGEGPYYDRLDEFIKDHDIKWTFIKSELANVGKAGNPVGYLIEKSYQFSDFRESINRVAYASTLLRASEAGQGPRMVKLHDWIDTDGLNTEDALGKISREVMTDYEAVSKPFRRWIRGGVAPFGTFYFKTSLRLWKWFAKHPVKGLAVFMSLPLAAVGYNNRNKEIREMEEKLPDYIRNRTHFVLGKNPDGTTRILSLQIPQDVLIGTKIFSILADHANRLARGEMSAEEAALKTLKQWGVREVEGGAYLLAPWIRWIRGKASDNKRDPYDKAPIYRRDPITLDWSERFTDEMLYFIKCSVPFLGASIQTYEKGLPQDIALKKYLDTFAGKGALGIYDVNPSGEIVLKRGGKEYTITWDDAAKISAIERKEMKHLGKIEDAFVASGEQLPKFIRSDAFKEELLNLFDYYAKFNPDIKDKYTEDQRVGFMQSALRKRLLNRLVDPSVQKKWYRVQLERAGTDAERQALAERYRKVQQQSLAEAIKAKPKTSRAIELMNKFKEHELPWDLILELP